MHVNNRVNQCSFDLKGEFKCVISKMMLQKIPFLSLFIVALDVVAADVGDLPPNR